MNLRVISGKYGGRQLDSPPGHKTHPMSERIRNAIFNSLGQTVDSAYFLDAFAGTGAVGVEALSRGAASGIFIEKDKIAQKCINNNFESLNITNAKLIKTSLSNWLSTYEGSNFDIIFADPPYHDTQINTIERLVSLLKNDGTLVLSLPQSEPSVILAGCELIFQREYSGARISMFKPVKKITK